jgi:hypothetical protein
MQALRFTEGFAKAYRGTDSSQCVPADVRLACCVLHLCRACGCADGTWARWSTQVCLRRYARHAVVFVLGAIRLLILVTATAARAKGLAAGRAYAPRLWRRLSFKRMRTLPLLNTIS